MADIETDKNLYELAYILPASPGQGGPSSQEQGGHATEQVAKLKQILEQQGGAITKEQNPMARRLAYPVAKQNEALFGYLRFTMEPEKTGELQKVLKLESPLLRFSLNKVTAQQLQEEEKMARIPRPAPAAVAPTYTPKPKEEVAPVKEEDFEKRLEEILKE